MKIHWSVFKMLILLTTILSCGKEEFGSVPKSTSTQPDALKSFSHTSCSNYTLIKPKVDVLYLVDNSLSQVQIPNAVKDGIKNTALTLSSAFDYRVIGTPLLETSDGNNDYQLMTNSTDLSGISAGKRIDHPNGFNFFTKSPLSGSGNYEKGLQRTISFIAAHKNGLLRDGAHLIIVIVSNGRDQEVEIVNSGAPNSTNTTIFNSRLVSLRNHKSSANLAQLRLFSVTAEQHLCKEGWWSANHSYVPMAQQIYTDSLASDNSTYQDSYNLCTNEHEKLFAGINASIQQQILSHSYNFWPINFADTNGTVSLDELKVFKISQNGTSVELPRGTTWNHVDKQSIVSQNTRILPTPGEPVSGRNFVEFTTGNFITYPDCVLIRSVSKTEYFGFIVLPQKPVSGSIAVWINGNQIPSSAWTDESSTMQTKNIKVDNLSATPPGSANPPFIKSGFMLKLQPAYYYKSGDNVEVNFIPAGV